MKLKEETGLASCYITCANKTDRQGEKVEKIKHRWNNRILDIKKENETEKKIEITFQINLSVTIQVSCFDDLIDFFFSQLIMKVHHRPLEFFSTYKPVTIHVRHWTFLVSLLLCLFLSSGCPSVEKFSKVNDAIALKKNVNLVQFKLTESDRSISFHPTTAFLALSLLDLISNSPDCLQYNSCYVVWRI